MSRRRESPRSVPRREEDRVVAPRPEGVQGPDLHVGLDTDARRPDDVEVPFQDVVRQPVARDPIAEHPAGPLQRLVHRHIVAARLGQVVGRRSGRLGRSRPRRRICPTAAARVRAPGPPPACQTGRPILERPDRDPLVELAAPARTLAGMEADDTAHRWQRQLLANDEIGVLELALGHEPDIAVRFDADRAEARRMAPRPAPGTCRPGSTAGGCAPRTPRGSSAAS